MEHAKKMVLVEPRQIEKYKETPLDKVLSKLDGQIYDILHKDISDDEKAKLYSASLNRYLDINKPTNSLRLPYLVFSIRSYLPLDCNRASSLRPTYHHPFGRPSTYFLGEFPGLGLALVPDAVVPEAEQRCTWSRKLDPNFCPGWGRTSHLHI